MADDSVKTERIRKSILMDAYTTLIAYKNGATPREIEKKIKDTLFIDYSTEYAKAGFRDMRHAMETHEKIQQISATHYSAVATAETAGIVAMVAKQKEKKKKRRPASAVFSRASYGFMSVRQTYRPSSQAFRQIPLKRSPMIIQPKKPTPPPMPVQTPLRAKTSMASMMSFPRPTTPPAFAKKTVKVTSKITTNTVLTTTDGPSTSCVVNQDRPKSCTLPSFKEFTENVQEMFIKSRPSGINIANLSDKYEEDYGQRIDPSQLFSKTWPMLLITSFESFLKRGNDSMVMIKDVWFEKYGARLMASRPTTAQSTSTSSPGIGDITRQLEGLSVNRNDTNGFSDELDLPPGLPRLTSKSVKFGAGNWLVEQKTSVGNGVNGSTTKNSDEECFPGMRKPLEPRMRREHVQLRPHTSIGFGGVSRGDEEQESGQTSEKVITKTKLPPRVDKSAGNRVSPFLAMRAFSDIQKQEYVRSNAADNSEKDCGQKYYVNGKTTPNCLTTEITISRSTFETSRVIRPSTAVPSSGITDISAGDCQLQKSSIPRKIALPPKLESTRVGRTKKRGSTSKTASITSDTSFLSTGFLDEAMSKPLVDDDNISDF